MDNHAWLDVDWKGEPRLDRDCKNDESSRRSGSTAMECANWSLALSNTGRVGSRDCQLLRHPPPPPASSEQEVTHSGGWLQDWRVKDAGNGVWQDAQHKDQLVISLVPGYNVPSTA